jgi:hypothetical protein
MFNLIEPIFSWIGRFLSLERAQKIGYYYTVGIYFLLSDIDLALRSNF